MFGRTGEPINTVLVKSQNTARILSDPRLAAFVRHVVVGTRLADHALQVSVDAKDTAFEHVLTRLPNACNVRLQLGNGGTQADLKFLGEPRWREVEIDPQMAMGRSRAHGWEDPFEERVGGGVVMHTAADFGPVFATSVPPTLAPNLMASNTILRLGLPLNQRVAAGMYKTDTCRVPEVHLVCMGQQPGIPPLFLQQIGPGGPNAGQLAAPPAPPTDEAWQATLKSMREKHDVLQTLFCKEDTYTIACVPPGSTTLGIYNCPGCDLCSLLALALRPRPELLHLTVSSKQRFGNVDVKTTDGEKTETFAPICPSYVSRPDPRFTFATAFASLRSLEICDVVLAREIIRGTYGPTPHLRLYVHWCRPRYLSKVRLAFLELIEAIEGVGKVQLKEVAIEVMRVEIVKPGSGDDEADDVDTPARDLIRALEVRGVGAKVIDATGRFGGSRKAKIRGSIERLFGGEDTPFEII